MSLTLWPEHETNEEVLRRIEHSKEWACVQKRTTGRATGDRKDRWKAQ